MNVMPLVDLGLVNLIPDPCDFDFHLRGQMMMMARARSTRFNPKDDPRLQRMMDEDNRRSIMLMPTDAMRRQVRKVNPDIIYVRGSGFGARGPEADKGGYDMTSFWARGGSGAGATPAGADRLSPMPAGGYGDNLGGMTIAGGIAAALYARATTG